MKKLQALKGMSDILPGDSNIWQYLESVVTDVLQRYGYNEIRFPVLEPTELFCRSIGEVTDIVEKEMYTFHDRNDLSISLRPEGTASCVRACEQHGLLYNQTQRLWYAGPMFRYEKPQKGRLRQFHQIGIEAYGMTGPDIDAEVLILTARLWQELGLSEAVTLQINNLGSVDARAAYKKALVEYLEVHKDKLDEDSLRRLDTNPLRILDSKETSTQTLLDGAPDLLDFIDAQSLEHFAQFKQLLEAADVSYEVNSRLVRGLDYYTGTVFEWVTSHLGAQGTVCAGGRYDGLVEQLGGKATPAVGCAMGIERLVLLLDSLNCVPDGAKQSVDIYFVAVGAAAQLKAFELSQQLRTELPSIRIINNCGGGSFKSQLKRADKSGAQAALILGENELADRTIGIKFLREQKDQQTVAWVNLTEAVNECLS